MALSFNLRERLQSAFKTIRGQGRLSEKNVRDTLNLVREALIDADVALSVVEQFLEHVMARAIGQEVLDSLNPGQALIKIVFDELVDILGKENAPINLNANTPVVILMAGLQGSGKTTSTAKLALLLSKQMNKKVLICSTDVYRPAALTQIATLAAQIGIDYFPATAEQKPQDIADQAFNHAKKNVYDVLLVDTAGRLHIDENMMSEMRELHQLLHPTETFFVVDAMTGQDAAKTAKAFHEALPLTGVIVSKADGDARMGAVLSIKYLTGKPIKFVGVGEKVDALEVFHPNRFAQRILDMGDVLSLIEEAERKFDKKITEKAGKKLLKGTFDLEDFAEQLEQVMNLEGGLPGILNKLPGVSGMSQAMTQRVNDKTVKWQIAIIRSMTKKERKYVDIIGGSRKRRIAQGSGRSIQEVNQLLKQFKQMQKMMKKMAQPGGIQKMMRGLQGMLPPGAFPR